MSHVPAAPFENADFDALLASLEEETSRLDAEDAWPATSFDRLREAGVLGWVIPAEYGGAELSAAELTRGYQRLASACLMTTFVLTQRNGACQRIAASENEPLKADLLPRLCRGELFATVGISHLSTSRQHLGTPAVAAKPEGDGFVLAGTVPWVTGAVHADRILVGGTCPDGTQILAVVAREDSGVEPGTTARMLALTGSHTGPVALNEVHVPAASVVAGPVEAVMKSGRGGGAGSVTTSALALGAAEGALADLEVEATGRDDVAETAATLRTEANRLAEDLYHLVDAGAESGLTSEGVRQRANSLVLRATQALLTATKGAGFVKGHAAERRVREATFFLVWSCPQPVAQAALREFACPAG